MKKEEKIIMKGKVIEALPDTMFRVELENGHRIIAYLCGKMRMNYIKVFPGNIVTVEMSKYDLTRGRIVWKE